MRPLIDHYRRAGKEEKRGGGPTRLERKRRNGEAACEAGRWTMGPRVRHTMGMEEGAGADAPGVEAARGSTLEKKGARSTQALSRWASEEANEAARERTELRRPCRKTAPWIRPIQSASG